MWTTDDLAVAATARVDPDWWMRGLDELLGRVAAPRLDLSEPVRVDGGGQPGRPRTEDDQVAV
jgi:hypothetical protein